MRPACQSKLDGLKLASLRLAHLSGITRVLCRQCKAAHVPSLGDQIAWWKSFMTSPSHRCGPAQGPASNDGCALQVRAVPTLQVWTAPTLLLAAALQAQEASFTGQML